MEYRPFYLAREWIKLGHKVTIVAASFSHLRSDNPCIHGRITEELIEGIRYIWLKTPGYHGNGIGRFMNMMAFSLKLIRQRSRIANDFRPDVVIASSPHPFIVFGARNIARFYNSTLVFEVRDLWPLSLTVFDRISPWHPFILFMQKTENFSYHVSDRVVSLLPKANSYMRCHGMAEDKFVYIPNGVSSDDWKNNITPVPQHHKELLKRLKKEGQFIVGYTGYYGVANALQDLIEAAFLMENIPVTFVLLGHGPEKKKLNEKTNRSELKNVLFLPPVPKSSIPNVLNLMDSLYIGWKRNDIYRFGVSPNKLMDYMMAAKPIIHAIDAGNDLVAESGCGISVPPEDPKAIAEAIRKIKGMTDSERKEMGLRGKEYVLAHHDYRILAKKYLDVLDK